MTTWKPPGTKIETKPAEKPKRDYVGNALAALNFDPDSEKPGHKARAKLDLTNVNPGLLGAMMLAQALDRFGARLSEAAAINNYKRD